MQNRIEAARNACLMQGMADKLGIDPDAALSAGRLDPQGLDAMVTRCRGCVHGDDCILWMVDHSEGANSAPGYCLNREELDLLRRNADPQA